MKRRVAVAQEIDRRLEKEEAEAEEAEREWRANAEATIGDLGEEFGPELPEAAVGGLLDLVPRTAGSGGRSSIVEGGDKILLYLLSRGGRWTIHAG